MNDRIIERELRCPVCREALRLSEDGHSLRCTGARTHCFDIASSGYVNFASPSQAGGGDSKELVRARSAFLGEGYYAPFAGALCGAVNEFARGGIVIDAGCGEGYYSVRTALAASADVCGFDLSKCAVDSAAKAAKRNGVNAFFAVAGIFDMPLCDACADAVINVFAPCAAAEFARVLKPGGYLIAAGAGPEHLFGLKSAIYETPTKNEPRADLPGDELELVAQRRVNFDIMLRSSDDIMALFSMTPYYYRTGQAEIDHLKTIQSLSTKVDIELFIYRKP